MGNGDDREVIASNSVNEVIRIRSQPQLPRPVKVSSPGSREFGQCLPRFPKTDSELLYRLGLSIPQPEACISCFFNGGSRENYFGHQSSKISFSASSQSTKSASP